MKNKFGKLGVVAGAAAFAFVASLPGARQADAAFLSCVSDGSVALPAGFGSGAYDISGKVSPSSACQIDPNLNNNDTPQPGYVNNTGNVNLTGPYFGISDWLYWGKDNAGGQSGSFNFLSGVIDEGPGSTGTFPVADAATLMIVFKDGGSTSLVAYIVPVTNGTWSSPFTEPPFSFPGSGARDVSHISYYYTLDDGTGSDAIPEPMTLALFGLGLAGLGVASRRRRAA